MPTPVTKKGEAQAACVHCASHDSHRDENVWDYGIWFGNLFQFGTRVCGMHVALHHHFAFA